jgi:aryl-alcohol dehydrogenase-like predicted oxidoreductase
VGDFEALSRFGLGCVTLGNKGREGVRLVHHALDLGVRVFDTADAYGGGSSERVLGQALRGRREAAIVATKAGYAFRERSQVECSLRHAVRPLLHAVRPRAQGESPHGAVNTRSAYTAQNFSPRYLRGALEASLRRLRTDYVDIYQLHGPQIVPNEDVMALMRDFMIEGKIRGFGVGLETLDQAFDWLATRTLATIQMPLSVFCPEARYRVIPRCVTLGIPVMARGVFAGGYLTRALDGGTAHLQPEQKTCLEEVAALAFISGVDAMQIAAWFVTAHEGVSTVVVGASSLQHLCDGVRYISTAPPPELISRLNMLGCSQQETS